MALHPRRDLLRHPCVAVGGHHLEHRVPITIVENVDHRRQRPASRRDVDVALPAGIGAAIRAGSHRVGQVYGPPSHGVDVTKRGVHDFLPTSHCLGKVGGGQ